ncbi:hypothetical protein [Prochlorococcus marinus]|uniref:hypothetical protein n=1 Tax=Prochlorococcus marinus TaxID=1219 RepID=UPI0022B42101|nr:hypothetical protein [Prochlorococcus marinus]
MITFIRSLSELMAITEPRDKQTNLSIHNEIISTTMDSAQRKRYIRSLNKKGVDLPTIPKTIRNKWIKNKEALSKFIDTLDYNNQIQSSYDLTLLERQQQRNQKDVA